MTTIARLLLGLSKKGIVPEIFENTKVPRYCDNDSLEICWKQFGKDISVFFNKQTGAYEGYTRSVIKGVSHDHTTESVSLRVLADNPNFRKTKITKSNIHETYDVDYGPATSTTSSSEIITTSIDQKANVYTVLQGKPSNTQVAKYDSIKIFPLSKNRDLI